MLSLFSSNRLLIPFFCALWAFACEGPPTAYEAEVRSNYIAHLELEGSTLVATTLVEDLESPWEISWGPDDHLWLSEQNGTVSRVDPETGARKVILQVSDVHYQKSRGLLGMDVHPRLTEKPYVFLHYTFLVPNPEMRKIIYSRLVRYVWDGDTLTRPHILLDSIPGNTFHNGSRILVTEDDKVFLSTGDAGHLDHVQDPEQLEGKILRLNVDGSIPADNPIPGNPAWSWGHRNAQGLVMVGDRLYASEHGPATDDEVNLIEAGNNYGWPDVHGFCDRPKEKEYCTAHGITEPLFAWTPTVAAAGLDYYDNPAVPEWRNSLLLTNLKGQALRVLRLSEDGSRVEEEKVYFQKFFGRLRDICVAENGDLFLATSNTDWHPRLQAFMYDTASLIKPHDDRIIRLRPADARTKDLVAGLDQTVPLREDSVILELDSEQWVASVDGNTIELGQNIYDAQCALCHRPDGKGVKELYPPLAGTSWVTGSKDRLIATVLRGLSDPIEVNGETYQEQMPAYTMLSDEEIAAVLTFIRKQWGNDAGPVRPAEVAEERRVL